MICKRHLLFIILIIIFLSSNAQERNEIHFPNIPGYITLKGDFHMHTPFSDGSVWPSNRVEEAWREGLDVMAITDPLEYHSYPQDINKDLNRPYEIAKPVADKYGIILIQAGEITRSMPPGHFNAFFLNDVNALYKDDYMDVFAEAIKQDAYIVWNHPGWKAQQPDTTKWWPIHEELYKKGWLKGIEIVNEKEYYPEVLQWALDKNLTMFGNSDIHDPIIFEYDIPNGEHRPMTIVFAKERTKEGIRDAFENQRTIVWFEDKLIGKKDLLTPFFHGCIKIKNKITSLNEKGIAFIRIENISSQDLLLESNGELKDYSFPASLTLPANKTVLIEVKSYKSTESEQTIKLPYIVKNMIIEPNKSLPVELTFEALSFDNVQIVPIENDSYKLVFDNFNEQNEVYYTIDGSAPSQIKNQYYSQSFTATKPLTIKYRVFKNTKPLSEIYEKSFTPHKGVGATVTYNSKFNKKYSGGGNLALVDGITAAESYHDGSWQGFQKDDIELIIEFPNEIEITTITANFLKNMKSWIFLPSKIEYSISSNGKDYTSLISIDLPIPEKMETPNKSPIKEIFEKVKAKYIKVRAENIGVCPEWHQGNGGAAWLFIDEIIIM